MTSVTKQGLVGLIPAVMHSNRVRAMGQPDGEYGAAFWITLVVSAVAWILVCAAMWGAIAGTS